MLSALHAEFQKAHRRHDLAICLVVPVVVFLWTGRLTSNDPEELANAYSALLYALPVLNAILMPVVMALLASRLWDIEVKGSTTKLLYTRKAAAACLRPRRPFGIGEVVLMVALEMGAAVLLGCTQHYTEALPGGAAVLSGRLHAGRGCDAVFIRAAADAGVGKSAACALRQHCRGVGRAVLGVYAAHRQLFVPWDILSR